MCAGKRAATRTVNAPALSTAALCGWVHAHVRAHMHPTGVPDDDDSVEESMENDASDAADDGCRLDEHDERLAGVP